MQQKKFVTLHRGGYIKEPSKKLSRTWKDVEKNTRLSLENGSFEFFRIQFITNSAIPDWVSAIYHLQIRAFRRALDACKCLKAEVA